MNKKGYAHTYSTSSGALGQPSYSRSSVLLSLWVACGSQVINPVEKRVLFKRWGQQSVALNPCSESLILPQLASIHSCWRSSVAEGFFSISLASVTLSVKQRKYSLFLRMNWDISQSIKMKTTRLIVLLIRSQPHLHPSCMQLTSKARYAFKDNRTKHSSAGLIMRMTLCAAY